jgi:ComEC/Rec2-related protein
VVVGAIVALSFWRIPTVSSGTLLLHAGRPALVVGRVSGYPVGRSNGDTFLLRAKWVRPSGGGTLRAEEVVSVYRKNPVETFTWGDEVSVWGPLLGLDSYPSRGGASARLFVPEGKSTLLRRASPFHPIRWATTLRERFHLAFQRHLPPSTAYLLSGVLLGERPPALEQFAADFRRSGTYHLLVASGSNVGFALGVWWVFSRWVLWWPRRWTIAVSPLVAFLYAYMAGGDPPVLRAAVMATVGAMGALLGRWDRLEHPLFLSAGILLLWDPACLWGAGFQMSYAATLAIAVVWGSKKSPGLEPTERRYQRNGVLTKIGHGAGDLFVTSLAAQMALAPFLLYYFGRFSWVGIGANMLAVPLAGLCLFLGAGLTVLDSFWPAAATVWAVPTRWGADVLAGWAHLCAQVPGAEWNATFNGPQAFVLALGVALGFVTLYLKQWRKSLFFLFAVVTFGVVWGLGSTGEPPLLDLSWRGGRSTSLWVRTTSGVTVFEKGGDDRKRGDSFRCVSLDSDRPVSDPWSVDGSRWAEGPTRWQVLRPPGGDGFAVRIDSDQIRTLLAFGLTPRQQKEWGQRLDGPVDLLSWNSGKGGPPQDSFLAQVNPRWMVYHGPRLSISARRSGVAVYRPGKTGLRWQADNKTAGFVPNRKR